MNSESKITTTLNQLNELHILKQSPSIQHRLRQLQDHHLKQDFLLVILGQFKRGKTSLINALLGESLLPTALIPLTSIITVIKPGNTFTITVHFKSGEVRAIDRHQLVEFITETHNPQNQKNGVKGKS